MLLKVLESDLGKVGLTNLRVRTWLLVGENIIETVRGIDCRERNGFETSSE